MRADKADTCSMTHLNALESATELAGDYRIDRVLGAGGFGVTYLADEMALNRLVTIKEYFPSDFAARFGACEAGPRSQASTTDYNWGLDRFIEEAQTLAKFDHPNIVRVYRTFRPTTRPTWCCSSRRARASRSWLKVARTRAAPEGTRPHRRAAARCAGDRCTRPTSCIATSRPTTSSSATTASRC